jgi:glycosyltransferase involved in cell wall biosynthesis
VGSAKKIFVVTPAYQAEDTIRTVFARLPVELEAKDCTYVVVDDGSHDRTAEVVRDLMTTRRNLRLLAHERNRGYAQAQKTGFAHALAKGADIVALLHADGQYAPELLPKLLAPLENDEADLVQGSRMLNGGALAGGMPLYKFVANKALTAIENLAFGLEMGEYHSGYMLYARRTLESIPFERLSDTFHFDGEMILMASKRRLRIRQIPIPCHYGTERSHLRPLKYGFDVLRTVYRNAAGYYEF